MSAGRYVPVYTSIELQTAEKIGKAFEGKGEGLARPSTLRARTKAWMRRSSPRKTAAGLLMRVSTGYPASKISPDGLRLHWNDEIGAIAR
jgi:hypothetical protein